MKKTLKICLVAVLVVCAMVVCAMTASALVTPTENDNGDGTVTYTVNSYNYYIVDNNTKTVTGQASDAESNAEQHFKWTFYMDDHADTDLRGKLVFALADNGNPNYSVMNTQIEDKTRSVWRHFKNKFKQDIISMELTSDQWRGMVYDEGDGSIFSNLPNLEEVYIKGRSAGMYMTIYWYSEGKNVGLFEGCTSLKTVWHGSNEKEVGTVDLSFINKYETSDYGHNIAAQVLKGCGNVKKVILGSQNTVLYADMFAGCTNLGEVHLTADITSAEAKFLSDATYGYVTCDASIEDNVKAQLTAVSSSVLVNPAEIPGPKDETVKVDEENYYTIYTDGTVVGVSKMYDDNNWFTWTFYTTSYEGTDESVGTLVFKGVEGKKVGSIFINSSNGIYKQFKDAYGAQIKTARFDSAFTGVYDEKYAGTQLLAGLANLKEVAFTSPLTVGTYGQETYDEGIPGFFEGCTALDTVYVGDSANRVEGTVDLNAIGGYKTGDTRPACGTASHVLKGCSSVKRVILGAANTTLYANMFKGCTLLEEVVVTVVPTVVESGFLSDAPDAVIFCDISFEVTLKALLTAQGVTNEVKSNGPSSGSMTFYGFKVRVNSYNGLRSLFFFNENLYGERMNNGFTLAEYGTIYVAENNYSNYEKTLNGEKSFLSGTAGAFVTPDSGRVIKTAVYMAGADNGGYVGNCDPTDNTQVSFVVTLTNIPDAHMASGVVSMGYEIWEKDGQYVAIYTEYSNPDYAVTSLYEVTMGMLATDVIKVTKGENPVWNCVNNCKTEEIEGLDAGITGLILEDPLNEDKYYALYATENTIATNLTSYMIPAIYEDKISGYIIGANITDKTSALPAGYEDWQEHMDTQLDKVPDGTSFAFITDTHWDSVPSTAQKSTALLKYAKDKVGFKTVVFGGDLLSKFTSSEVALTKLQTYWHGEMSDTFGSDALYVRGNHDSNDLGTLDGTDNGPRVEPIRDTVMYENTVAQIAGAKLDVDGINNFVSKVDEYITACLEANPTPPQEVEKPTNKEAPDYEEQLAAYENWDKYQRLTKYDKSVYLAEAEAFMKLHYYKDYEDQKIRYISLDSGGKTWTQTYISPDSFYNATLLLQLKWLVSVLDSTPEDYNVVVAAHSFGDEGDSTNIIGNSATKAMTRILSNFMYRNNKYTPWPVAYGDFFEFYLNADPSDHGFGVPADFSKRGGNSKVVVLGGHCHKDMAYYVNGTAQEVAATDGTGTNLENAILFVRTGSDAIGNGYGNDVTHTEPYQQQRFDIVTFTADGKVAFTRIGAGSDRLFQY